MTKTVLLDFDGVVLLHQHSWPTRDGGTRIDRVPRNAVEVSVTMPAVAGGHEIAAWVRPSTIDALNVLATQEVDVVANSSWCVDPPAAAALLDRLGLADAVRLPTVEELNAVGGADRHSIPDRRWVASGHWKIRRAYAASARRNDRVVIVDDDLGGDQIAALKLRLNKHDGWIVPASSGEEQGLFPSDVDALARWARGETAGPRLRLGT